MESYVEKAEEYPHTRGSHEIIGKRVLAKSGTVLGSVREVRLNKETSNFEGVVIGRSFRKPQYICKSYIEKVTQKAVLLSIEPVSQYQGRTVISSDGKKIGMVKSVERVNDTNRVASILVYRGWGRKTTVPMKEITQLGVSITLAKTYEQLKRDRKA